MCHCRTAIYSREIGSRGICQHRTLNIRTFQQGIQQSPRCSASHVRLRVFVAQCLDVQEPASTSNSQSQSSEKSDKNKRSSWENVEVRSLIAAYRENYDHLKSTKSSHGKKTVWDVIFEDFLSLCSDAGVDSLKTSAQIKHKWRSLFDKYKAVKDNNNKTGRDRKTFDRQILLGQKLTSGMVRWNMRSVENEERRKKMRCGKCRKC